MGRPAPAVWAGILALGYTLVSVLTNDGEPQGRQTAEGGDTYAAAEGLALSWWIATDPMVPEGRHTEVEILDANGCVLARVRRAANGGPSLVPADGGTPATVRWLDRLRGIGTLAGKVRGSAKRLSSLGEPFLSSEASIDALDACASRLGLLIHRVEGLMRHGLDGSGGDPEARLALRRAYDEIVDGADIEGYLALTTDTGTHVPPSTLGSDRIHIAMEAMSRVCAAMLRACEAVEAHASGETFEPGPTLRR